METTIRQATIGNVTVYKSEPFDPVSSYFSSFIGRRNELRLITASWISGAHKMPLNPILIGVPGIGKNRLVYEIAKKTSHKLFIFQGHEDVTAEELCVSVRFGKTSNTVDYILSPLSTAMIEGGICLLDEIGKCRPKALALLVSVLDERRYIDSNLLGERIHAHPGFRFIAATNTTDINLLPEFILSRMRPQINVGYPSKDEIDDILRRECDGLNSEVDDLIDLFWVMWREHTGQLGNIAPRDALYLFGLASRLSAIDETSEYAEHGNAISGFADTFPDKGLHTGISRVHLEMAFHKLFTEPIHEMA